MSKQPALAPAEQRAWVANPENLLILVSLDGFRWDYLDLYQPPHLLALAERGVRAEGLIPVYPSKTFPCHYSIVTGLYPAHHGIVWNDIYDEELDAEFHLWDRQAKTDPRWWDGEPIWVTAERQGVRSASIFWPGSEGPIGGVQPTHWLPYDDDLDNVERVEKVLGWLDLAPGRRPRMISLYFSDTDEVGHRYGPRSPETAAVVHRLDDLIGLLVGGIEQRGLAERAHLVVVSDHGMAAISEQRRIQLGDYLELADDEVFQQGAVLQLHPGPGRETEILAALDGAHPRLAIYRRGSTPDHFRLGNGSRVPPILGVPAAGWQVFAGDTAPHWARSTGGDHGYDPRDPSMHGLFVAAGSALVPGQRVERFESVHVYHLMAAILGLDPAPNDGDPEVLAPLLTKRGGLGTPGVESPTGREARR